MIIDDKIIDEKSIAYCIIIYIWANYNDLTVLPSPGIMVYFREIIPKWPNNSG